MAISKGGIPLVTLEEWRQHGGPKRPEQWVDGRSAKESARAWLGGGGTSMPPADSTGSTMTAAILLQSPTQVSSDSRQGNPQGTLDASEKHPTHCGVIGSRTVSGTLGSESLS